MKTCFLFPGQGAQYPGMGKDLWENSQAVKELFELASDSTSMDLTRLLFQGSEEELKQTNNTQIAVTLVNLSVSAFLKEQGVQPEGFAGFSLGEYSALCEAGVLDKEDIFAIVKARGEFMEKSSREADTAAGKSGMAAVIGLSREEAEAVLTGDLAGENIYLANHSSPIQVVLSGTADALQKAEEAFDKAGAMKYVILRVSGPFHCPLQETAKKELEEFLGTYTFRDPKFRVYSNAAGAPVTTGDEARKNCVKQIVSTVEWLSIEQHILDDGFERYLETGPGKVLSGLWKSFYRKVRCKPAGTLEAIEEIINGEA
jgi:[acyl-carrier-protein] S-malonyltransferase